MPPFRLRGLLGLALAALAPAVAFAQTPAPPADGVLPPDPCDAVVTPATAHYVSGEYGDVERLAAPCAARADAPMSLRVQSYRLLALSYLRQELFHEAQMTLLKLLATDPGYGADPVQDPPVYVALVTSLQAQLQRTPPAGDAPAAPVAVVHLNTATEAELDSVPGIGPVIAQRIVAFRQANGPFRSVADLEQVSGIGPRTIERLSPYLTTAPAGTRAGVRATLPAEAAAGGVPARQSPDTPATRGARVNLNTASAEELDTLPGIGPAIAQRILDYRAQHGPFQSVDALVEVSGIGERVLERLRPYLTIGD